VPVPIYRSRTNMKDVLIDLAVMPAAWWRVMALRAKPAGMPRTLAVWLPLAILAPFALLLAVIGSKNIFLGVDAINNYVHVWYLNDQLVNHLDFPIHAEPLDSGRATALPYGGVPWLIGAVLYEFLGARSVTLLLVVGLLGLVGAATNVRPAMRSPWMMILFILNPFFIDAVFSVQFPFIWSTFFFFLFVIALDRRHYVWAGVLAWMAVSAQPVNGGLSVAAYTIWAFVERRDQWRPLALMSVSCMVALIPVAVLTLETPALSDNGRWLIVRSLIADIPRRGIILAFPFAVQALGPLILRHYRLAAGAVAAALAIWLPFANGAFGIAEGNYTAGLRHDPRDPYVAFDTSPAFVRGAHYRILTPNEREEGYYFLVRRGAVLASELFTESQFKRSFRSEQYGCFLRAKEVDFVLVERDYFRQYPTNELALLQSLVTDGSADRAFVDPAGRYEVFDVRSVRADAPEPTSVSSCRLRPPPRNAVSAAR